MGKAMAYDAKRNHSALKASRDSAFKASRESFLYIIEIGE